MNAQRMICTVWSLLALSLSACSFAPLTKLPAPQASASYAVQPPAAKSAEADGVAQRYDLGAHPVPEWWHQYNSPALDALVEEGLRDNASLDAARHTLQSAHDLLKAQVRQNELPTLDGAGLAARDRNPSLSEVGLPSNLYNVYAGQLELSYTFDVFGVVRHGNRQAMAQVDQQAYELDAAKRTVAANIVIAAINAAALAEQVTTTERLSVLAHEQATLVEQSYRLGSLSHEDLWQAQQNAASMDANLPPLRAQAMHARHALAVLMGRSPDQAPVNLELATLHLPQDVPVSVPSDLLRQRPDVLAAEAAVHVASERVGVATGNLFPQITLGASMGTAALKAASLFTSGAASWGIGALVNQPIFHGGALLAQRKAAVEAYDASLDQYRQTVLNAFENVADTLTVLDQDALTLQAAQAASQAAAASFADTDTRYRLGAVSYPSTLSSELHWQNMQLPVIQARAARLADTAALFQAMGSPSMERLSPITRTHGELSDGANGSRGLEGQSPQAR